MLHNYNRKDHANILTKVASIIEAGNLKPIVDEKRFSLDEVNEAHAYLESKKAMGKVVIENG